MIDAGDLDVSCRDNPWLIGAFYPLPLCGLAMAETVFLPRKMEQFRSPSPTTPNLTCPLTWLPFLQPDSLLWCRKVQKTAGNCILLNCQLGLQQPCMIHLHMCDAPTCEHVYMYTCVMLHQHMCNALPTCAIHPDEVLALLGKVSGQDVHTWYLSFFSTVTNFG